MSLEAFTGEASKPAFPHIPWTAEGAEGRRGGFTPDCSIPSAWLMSGRMEWGVSKSQFKDGGLTAEII